ncbi:MAG TPA: class I SAM-dependent methyltransferase [Polyangiaceae bacterium]|jgi:O-methyltransferase involved in polyketide biosynthesis
MTATRDFSSISPSARSLLLVKAQTTLPYAREAAELLFGAGAVAKAREEAAADPKVAGRQKHFEIRARSIDEALAARAASRVLELAAGLSLRGLAMAERADVVYVDTDLPELAATKADLLARLHPAPLDGVLLVRALDALDTAAFQATVAAIPAGPLAVVHEGLLMYLRDDEKARLAANVREALLARGGAWITADVYVRGPTRVHRDAKTQAFLDRHNVEDNKFASFAAAAAFFAAQGFALTAGLRSPDDPWPVRETWVLEAR